VCGEDEKLRQGDVSKRRRARQFFEARPLAEIQRVQTRAQRLFEGLAHAKIGCKRQRCEEQVARRYFSAESMSKLGSIPIPESLPTPDLVEAA
jgi:hypothetical protein